MCVFLLIYILKGYTKLVTKYRKFLLGETWLNHELDTLIMSFITMMHWFILRCQIHDWVMQSVCVIAENNNFFFYKLFKYIWDGFLINRLFNTV